MFLSIVVNVEMEIVLPGSMTVAESHDIALDLQDKIESLPDVERAFIHVDHLRRERLEHRTERELLRASLKVQPSLFDRLSILHRGSSTPPPLEESPEEGDKNV